MSNKFTVYSSSDTSTNLGSSALTAGASSLTGLTVTGLAAGIAHSSAGGVFSSSTIVNADVSASAAIAGTKISPAFGTQNISTSGTLGAGAATVTGLTVTGLAAGIAHSSAGGVFSSSDIVNADVSASAAIAGTKISPAFGTQNISTSGTLGAGAATVTGLTVSGLAAGIAHSSAGGVFSSSTIVNADVSASAAIAGTKVSPAFGAQAISTTGTTTLGVALTFANTANVLVKPSDSTTNASTGFSLTIQGQNETGTTSTGGQLTLTSGTGTSTNGNLVAQVGGSTFLTATPTTTSIGYAGNTNIALSSGTVSLSVATVSWTNTVVSPSLYQANDTTASATGDALSIHAQNATGTTATGGALNMSSGTGTTAPGDFNLYRGSNAVLQSTTGDAAVLPQGSLVYVAESTTRTPANDLVITAQHSTNVIGVGGDLVLSSGMGTSSDGEVIVQRGGSVWSSTSSTGFDFQSKEIKAGTGVLEIQNDSSAPTLVFNRYRASAAAVQAGDILGVIGADGYDGFNAVNTTGIMGFVVDNTVSDGYVPTLFIIQTSASAEAGLITRFSIASDGTVTFGDTGASNTLSGSEITGTDGTWTSPFLPKRETLSNTTDATPTPFTDIAFTDNFHSTIELRIECPSSTHAVFTYQSQVQVKMVSGTLTMLQENPSGGTVYDGIGVGGIALSVVSNKLHIVFTGKATTTITPNLAYWIQKGFAV